MAKAVGFATQVQLACRKFGWRPAAAPQQHYAREQHEPLQVAGHGTRGSTAPAPVSSTLMAGKTGTQESARTACGSSDFAALCRGKNKYGT